MKWCDRTQQICPTELPSPLIECHTGNSDMLNHVTCHNRPVYIQQSHFVVGICSRSSIKTVFGLSQYEWLRFAVVVISRCLSGNESPHGSLVACPARKWLHVNVYFHQKKKNLYPIRLWSYDRHEHRLCFSLSRFWINQCIQLPRGLLLIWLNSQWYHCFCTVFYLPSSPAHSSQLIKSLYYLFFFFFYYIWHN